MNQKQLKEPVQIITEQIITEQILREQTNKQTTNQSVSQTNTTEDTIINKMTDSNLINDTETTNTNEMEHTTINDSQALVTAVHRDRYELSTQYGELYARLKTGIYYNEAHEENFPTVGDQVIFTYNPIGDSLITKTLERKSHFSRHNPTLGLGEQLVAANFDYVFIMTSLNHDLNLKRLERYLTVSWQSGGTPVIILSKADLEGDMSEAIDEIRSIAFGVEVYAISSYTGYGIEQLASYLKPGKMIALLGSSGVGKSTFVNRLMEYELMETNGVREHDSRGRHTTTYRQLIFLPSGAMIIDTPGMRELGMWETDEGIGHTFSDVEELLTKCRFANCTHHKEPGCAVVEAINAGSLDLKHWQNYSNLVRESKHFARKEERKSRTKSICKHMAKTACPVRKKTYSEENAF